MRNYSNKLRKNSRKRNLMKIIQMKIIIIIIIINKIYQEIKKKKNRVQI